MRSRYVPDRGLGVRMLATMGLLGGLYVVLILAVVWFLNVPWPVAVLIGAVGLGLQYALAGRAALAAMGAREVTPEEAPELHAVVDRICALSNVPKPRVAIANTDLPNAFASGRSAKSATVCATTGLMRRLDRRELEAVLAHEMAHVAHRDVVVMSLASVVALAAGLLIRLGVYGGMNGGGRDDRRDRNNRSALPLILLAAAVVYGLSFVLIRMLSRYRELSADRSAALLTGQPSVLASALVKITGEMGTIPTNDLRQAEAYNSLFLVPAIAGGFSLTSLFSTHPTLEARLEQLNEISDELGRAG